MAHQTDVMPGRKSHSHRARKAVIVLALIAAGGVLLLADSRWPDPGVIHETIEWTGLVLIGLCVAGRTCCTLYIGGRKNAELIQDGPYSVVRNPLYVFSILGAAGAGAQMGSIVFALVFGFVTWAVFLWLVLTEEPAMERDFGSAYRDYCAKVPRFRPKFSNYHSRPSLVVYPHKIFATFTDAILFFLALPIMEVFDYLHEVGILPTYFLLP